MSRVLGASAALGLCVIAACTGDRASFGGNPDAVGETSTTGQSTDDPTDPSGTDGDPDPDPGTGNSTGGDAAATDSETVPEPNDTDETDDTDVSTPTPECEARQTDECGACGVRTCDPQSLQWGPCTGDGRAEECWETETGGALPQAAAGEGNCLMGERTCGEDGEWGACLGAIAPVAADVCDVAGDDGNCNGADNEGCDCEANESRDCGSDVGNCESGTQTCDPAGQWGECEGQVAPQLLDSCEVEGDDADCDERPNEGCACTSDVPETCDDALACTDEVCSLGVCENPIKAGFCLIEGQCYGPNQAQTGNVCNVCNPEQNPTAWSAVATGTVNPENTCQVCSGGGLIANTGANCGAGPTECSAQDTCDSSAVCQPNHNNDGETCAQGECAAGECAPLPFDCFDPTPPAVTQPTNVYVLGDATPPTGDGGTLRDGRYTHTRIDVYGTSDSTWQPVRTFEVRSQYVQVAHRDWTSGFFAIGEVQFAGTFTTVDNTLTWDLDNCDPQYNFTIPTMEYTATANGLITIERKEDGVVFVTMFARD